MRAHVLTHTQGPILAFIWAVRELMNACGGGTAADGCVDGGGAGGGGCNKGRLPVNVAFVFEGEEENGSRGFTQAVQQNPRWGGGGGLQRRREGRGRRGRSLGAWRASGATDGVGACAMCATGICILLVACAVRARCAPLQCAAEQHTCDGLLSGHVRCPLPLAPCPLPDLPTRCSLLPRPCLRFFEGTELIIISNTLWVGENVPCLTYGMRGMLSLTLQVGQGCAWAGDSEAVGGLVVEWGSVAALLVALIGLSAAPCHPCTLSTPPRRLSVRLGVTS